MIILMELAGISLANCRKAGQFKMANLRNFKEYERDYYNPDIEYVSKNYSYHQGLLDGITSLSYWAIEL